jgi:hypothetical protein
MGTDKYSITGINAETITKKRNTIMEIPISTAAGTPANSDQPIKADIAPADNATSFAGDQSDESISSSSRIEGSRLAKMYSATEISWRQRRMKTAESRYSELVDERDLVSRIVRTKTIMDPVTQKIRKLTSAEIASYRVRKRELIIDVPNAKRDFMEKKDLYLKATGHNNKIRTTEWETEKMETNLLKTMDDMVKEATSALEQAERNGYGDQIEHLRFLVKGLKKKDFRRKLSELLTDLDQTRWETVLQFKSIDSELAKRIYDTFKPSKVV